MPLADLTRDAVLAAVQEHDALGREAFLRQYGFHPAREYSLIVDGRQYDSKAIAGVAHKYARPDVGPLRAGEFSGGEATVRRALERLGFVVRRTVAVAENLANLRVGQIYSWDELSTVFDFKPSLFQVGGGMLSRPELNALLLITHPGGARSFDYEDRWDGETLIYTGAVKVATKSCRAKTGTSLKTESSCLFSRLQV